MAICVALTKKWVFGLIGKVIFGIDAITKFGELLRSWFGSVHESLVSRFKSARFYYDRRMCRREARTSSFGPENVSTRHADASSASSNWTRGHRMQGRGRSGTSALGSRGSRRVGHSDAQKHLFLSPLWSRLDRPRPQLVVTCAFLLNRMGWNTRPSHCAFT
jgi:hypothetical protein